MKEEKTVNVIDEFPFIAKEEPFSLSDFYDLITASDIFTNFTERYYYVFVKSGYTQAYSMKAKAQRKTYNRKRFIWLIISKCFNAPLITFNVFSKGSRVGFFAGKDNERFYAGAISEHIVAGDRRNRIERAADSGWIFNECVSAVNKFAGEQANVARER